FCLYPMGSVLRAYYLIRENQTYPNVAVENARLAAYMPHQGTKIIAPIDFFFGQMDNYRIRSLTYYSLLNSTQYQDQLTVPEFFAMAAQDSVMYIVSDHRTWNQAYHIPPNAPARIGAYQRVFQDQWHSIYTYKSPVLTSLQK
ncbi:MAG TPA: hypothetical protein VK364_04410, partial [Hymenobacter sp.]|nr:hypothetical protein [Hymenobacter sp.]